MKKYIMQLFEQTGDLDITQVIMHITVAAILGMFIFVSYWISHKGTIYSKKFNVTLVVLTVLTATVMTAVGNNVVLSLGMVGALSIVRFRTALKDSRDTAYVFWAVIVGICCGVGDYKVAAIGSVITLLLLMLLGRIKNDNRMLLIIRGARTTEKKVEALIFSYFERKANLRVKNTTETTVEFIYEISRKMLEDSAKHEKSITDALYEIGNMEYVNLVAQNDEIGS
ncbi:MAG: DUF4956 domain-containing protein [Lachnospiraceae bacterium]|nr:DUF4956 domain-containing protein [Lachnospiraceae bacterium]